MIYPENLIPFSIIGIGYSAKEINSINRFRFDSTKVHFNKL